MGTKAGSALKKTLRKHKLSQNQLALKLGRSRSTVNQWVTEIHEPLAKNIPEIADALDDLRCGASSMFLEEYLDRMFVGKRRAK